MIGLSQQGENHASIHIVRISRRRWVFVADKHVSQCPVPGPGSRASATTSIRAAARRLQDLRRRDLEDRRRRRDQLPRSGRLRRGQHHQVDDHRLRLDASAASSPPTRTASSSTAPASSSTCAASSINGASTTTGNGIRILQRGPRQHRQCRDREFRRHQHQRPRRLDRDRCERPRLRSRIPGSPTITISASTRIRRAA